MAEEKDPLNTQFNKFFHDGNICPSCKTGFTIHHSETIYYCCTKCHSYLDVSEKGNYKKVSAAHNIYIPALPLGAKGEFNGTSYEVITYTRCREYKSIYKWNEYYLYNKFKGFAFLSEYDGHWIFLSEIPKMEIHKNSKFRFKNLEYVLYSRYKTEIVYAEGEFDFNLFSRELLQVREYIHPPYLVSNEQRGSDKYDLKGEYVTPKEMSIAFAASKIPVSLPPIKGVGAIQPFIKSYSMRTLWLVAMLGVLALLLGHFVIETINSNDKVVFEQAYQLSDTLRYIHPIVSSSFEIPESPTNMGNLEIELNAPVNQTWFETQINLVNDETGEEYGVSEGVEYYSGYDDGAWSEGSTSHSIMLSSIPAGKYHLNIFPSWDEQTALKKPGYFQLKLTRNVTMKANFFLILLLILAFPLFQFWRYRHMENQRWMNSNV